MKNVDCKMQLCMVRQQQHPNKPKYQSGSTVRSGSNNNARLVKSQVSRRRMLSY